MCLFIKSGPHVAKKTFYTLKVAEKVKKDGCHSFYRNAYQKYNTTLCSILKVKSRGLLIGKGLHSLIGILPNNNPILDHDPSIMDRGIVLCKVPKGATYYLGHGDIVSNKLIIIEPLVVQSNLLEEKLNLKWREWTLESFFRCAVKICKSYNLNMIPS